MTTLTEKKPSVYELGVEWQVIQSLLLEAEGEITDEIAQRLAALETGEADRVDAYRVVVMGFEAQAKMLSEEIDHLKAKRDSATKAAQRLKERLLAYLEARGVDRLRGTIWEAAKTKNGGLRPLTVTVPVEALPLGLVKREPDTGRIRALIGADGRARTVDGDVIAELGEAGFHLRFR